MIRIYHNPHASDGGRYYRDPISQDDIFVALQKSKLIAAIETDDLELAYKLTQNIESPWIDNQQVTLIGLREEQRSTSVGDILVDTLGDIWIVAPFGFTHIG